MKRIIVLLTMFLIVTGCRHMPAEDQYTTTIYYVPHPDDETLSMGPSILHNISLEKDVVVVLLSKGRASKVFYSVNKKLEKENLPLITLEAFGEARVAEFREAVAMLGVQENNVFVYDVEDGDFTVEEIIPIIEEFEQKYPGALHNVMSYKDKHSDHASTGKALQALLKDKKVENGLYHVPIQRHRKMYSRGSYPVPIEFTDRYEKALDVYGIWKPEEESYSIGKTSVKKYFEQAILALESRWH